MAIYNDIQAALDTKLNGFATTESLEVAWPNVDYVPSGAYLTGVVVPAETQVIGLPYDDTDKYQGIYQIDVRVPKGKGTQESRTITDLVLAEFEKGSSETINTTTVRVINVWASSAFDIDAAYMSVPISVRYEAFA